MTKSAGDKITIKADDVQGTPEAQATILKVTTFGYVVHVDGDEPGWHGPVDHDGHVLSDAP